MIPRVFLSHASADAEIAKLVEEALRASLPGVDVFRTTRTGSIPAGDDWFHHILDQLRECDRYMLLLSEASQRRPWVCFEAGAAKCSLRPFAPVLVAGLRKADVVEPLSHLQLLDLEFPDEAADAIARLGGTLSNPNEFSARVKAHGESARLAALEEQGWAQVVCGGLRFAWEGPIEALKEGDAVPETTGLRGALAAAGQYTSSGYADDLGNEFSQGFRRLWHIDARLRKRAVVAPGGQVLIVRPATQ